MSWWILHQIRNLWPFWNNKKDDLKVSDILVQPLPVPDPTIQFVFAMRDPDNSSVVYLLAAERLSERSSRDADCLVSAIKPKLVVAQIGPSSLDDVREERNISVPTSSLGVLKGCFLERINSSKYERRAGTQVLEIIFGTRFYGHVLAAKQAAVENQSLFLFLETPQKNVHYNKLGAGSKQSSSQNGPKETSQGSRSSEGLTTLSGDTAAASSLIHPNRLKLAGPVDNLALRAFLSDSGSNSAPASNSSSPAADDFIPSFAYPFYNLLTDLHEIFKDLPAINKALAYVGKMLADAEKGKATDCHVLEQVSSFRIAVEGLRIAINSEARNPIKEEHRNSRDGNFYELPHEEKCRILFAQALRQQAQKFNTVVAIVDASSLAGIRCYWNTLLFPRVRDLADKCFISDSFNSDIEEDGSKSRSMFLEKLVVAVGAGAEAIVGMSFSKIVPVSTFIKMALFKVSRIMKFGLLMTKRTAAPAMGKNISPAKYIAPTNCQGFYTWKASFCS